MRTKTKEEIVAEVEWLLEELKEIDLCSRKGRDDLVESINTIKNFINAQ